MSAVLELDQQRRDALEEIARRRKVAPRRLLQLAVDELIKQMENDELLEESARIAKRSGLRERAAVQVVKKWRAKQRGE